MRVEPRRMRKRKKMKMMRRKKKKQEQGQLSSILCNRDVASSAD